MTHHEARTEALTDNSTFSPDEQCWWCGWGFPVKPGTGRCFSIHKGRVHIQFLDKTHWGKQGQTNLRKYVCFQLQDKPAVMKVKGDGWGYRPAIYFESVNPILMIVLKKNVAKKVDFLIGMSEKVATRSRMQRLNKPSKDDILRGFSIEIVWWTAGSEGIYETNI